MKTYIIKRLLLMAVTLFGIALITFVIVQAAPGDPATARTQGPAGGGKTQISKEIIEQTRRLYALDKPIIFNPAPDDRESIQARLLGKLASEDEEEQKTARSELLEVGTVALARIRTEAERAPLGAHRERLRELAAQIEAARVQDPEGQGALAVPELIGDASDPGSPRRDPAQARLAAILRKAWAVPDDAANRTRLESKYDDAVRAGRGTHAAVGSDRDAWIAAEREREARGYAARWKAYWRDNQDRFLVYEGWARWKRMLTQTRFGRWFGMLLRGDFGESYRTKQRVTDMIIERLPISLQLSLISAFVAYLIAIPLGVHSAVRSGSRLDGVLTVGLFILYSLPSFFVAQMLIIFTTGGDYPLIFPTGHLTSAVPEEHPFGSAFLDRVWHLILPIAVLTYGSFAYISRQMRASMLEVIRQDYIRTARAKGLSERVVIFKHALRNSLIPIVTMLGSLLPHLLSGSVIIESIFTIEGMGKLGFDSVINRDYPVILGIAFFSALLTLLGILISDLSYAVVDPRIAYE